MSVLTLIYDALSTGAPPVAADAIFVLAGSQPRKRYARRLWSEGLAPDLILSIGRFEWRRVLAMGLPHDGDLANVVAAVPPERRHFFLRVGLNGGEAFAVQPGRFGTWTEARALARLARTRGYRSILVVSDATHLRRARLALSRAFEGAAPRLDVVRVPDDEATYRRRDWWHTRAGRRAVLGELFKLPIYGLFVRVRRMRLY